MYRLTGKFGALKLWSNALKNLTLMYRYLRGS